MIVPIIFPAYTRPKVNFYPCMRRVNMSSIERIVKGQDTNVQSPHSEICRLTWSIFRG